MLPEAFSEKKTKNKRYFYAGNLSGINEQCYNIHKVNDIIVGRQRVLLRGCC